MLFNTLFRGEANEPVGPFTFRSTKFEEMFDHNKLAFILLNEKQIKEGINRKARDEVELLSYYKKAHKYNETVAGVSVRYYQPSTKLLGRYQARGKLSGQGMLREVRHTIYADFYCDLDMVNAHPVILRWLCEYFDIDCACLVEYVDNREQRIAEILDLNPGVSREDVKAVFLSINNGGVASYNEIENKTEFLVSYKNEMQSVIDAIVDKFPSFLSIVKAMKESRGKTFNVNGATIAHVLQYIENQLLMIIFEFVENRIGDKAYNSILCYDGIMLLKSLYDPDWQSELEELFSDEYGIEIKLKVKDMDPIDLSKYDFEEDEQYDLEFAESIATTVASYRSILDNTDSFKERALVTDITEEDVVIYLLSLGEAYIHAGEQLYRYNGFYWEGIGSEYVYHLIGHVYTRLLSYINTEWDSQNADSDSISAQRKTILKRIRVLKTQSFKKSMYAYIRDQYHSEESPFNLKPLLLGFTNGTYDLELGVFRAPCKEDYISMVLPYAYASSSEEDMNSVITYLGKIMPDESERELLLQLLSTCLSGIVLDRFIVCTGLGSNGKDALFSYLLKTTLGPFYYRGSTTTLTQASRSDLNVGVANMHLKRAVVFSEPSTQCMIQCALVKEVTGGDHINARGLYSSNSSVTLHQTTWMLCNDKPLLDKVDSAIARRLITFNFRSLFQSAEYLSKNKLVDGENNVFLGQQSVKSSSFLNKYKLPFVNVLLPYFKRFVEDKYEVTGIPETILKESRQYMEESDLLYVWFNSTYQKKKDSDKLQQSEELVVRLSLWDVFASVKESNYYMDLTKAERRKFSYKSLLDYVSRSPLLRAFYHKKEVSGKTTHRNFLLNFEKIPVSNESKEDLSDDE